MTSDIALERMVRDVLVASRPTEAASSALREKVLRIPTEVPMASMHGRLFRFGALPVAVLGIAAAALAFAAFGLTRVPASIPPGAGSGGVTGFDASITGMGLLPDFVPGATILGGLVAVLSGIWLAATFFSSRSGTNRGRASILLAIGGVALGLAIIRLDVGLSGGNVRGAPLGYVVQDTPVDPGPVVYYEDAATGAPSVLIFSLYNPSPVPVHIDGIVLPGVEGPTSRHWTGLWLPPANEPQSVPGVEAIRPFQPFDLAPGALSTFYLAAQGGPCAVGPSFDPRATPENGQGQSFTQFGPSFTIAYSVFGLSNRADIDIGEEVVLPQRQNCVSFG